MAASACTVTEVSKDPDNPSEGFTRDHTSQNVAVSGTSAASTNAVSKTGFVRLSTDVGCRYAIGAAPTALATGPILPANSGLVLKVTDTDKVAVISI